MEGAAAAGVKGRAEGTLPGSERRQAAGRQEAAADGKSSFLLQPSGSLRAPRAKATAAGQAQAGGAAPRPQHPSAGTEGGFEAESQ